MGEATTSVAVISITLNVISSVGVVVLNKALFASQGFLYPTVLGSLHQVMTLVILELARLGGLFTVVEMPPLQIFKLALLSTLNIGSMNVSLQYNTLGTYQLSKLLVMPCTAVIERLFYGTVYDIKVKFFLTLLAIGVGLATITSLSVNPFGFAIMVFSVLITSAHQTINGATQRKLGCSPFQAIYEQTPFMLIMMPALAPFFDDLSLSSSTSFWHYHWTFDAAMIIIAGCVMAGILNISGFFIVGGLSAMTYQVLANMKTVAILIFGKLLFGEPVTVQQSIGVVCGILGLLGYTKYKAQGTKEDQPLVSGCQTLAEVRRALLVSFLFVLLLAWGCHAYVARGALIHPLDGGGLDTLTKPDQDLAFPEASYVEQLVLPDNQFINKRLDKTLELPGGGGGGGGADHPKALRPLAQRHYPTERAAAAHDDLLEDEELPLDIADDEA